MKVDHEAVQESLIASICASDMPHRHDIMEAHAKACPECSKWQTDIEQLVSGLSGLALAVPDKVNQVVHSLLNRGLTEDPWYVLWEVAQDSHSESSGSGPLYSMPRSHTPVQREAAEIVPSSSRISLEEEMRKWFVRVVEATSAEGSRLVLGVTAQGTCAGVLLSQTCVPLAGAKVMLLGDDGKVWECTSDLRGAFRLETGSDPPSGIKIGFPLSIELRF